MRKKKRREIEVTIDDWASSGNGMGFYERPDGERDAVEVPFSVPGDRYFVEISRKRKGVFQAWPLSRVESSQDRMDPKCSHFATCGGCRWQQIDYSQQLQLKIEGVRQALAPLNPSPQVWHPILPCTPPWHYRNKMEFSFSQNKAGDLFAGLYMSRGKVFNLTECHLVNSWFAEALVSTKQWALDHELTAYHPPVDTGSLRTLTAREGWRSGDRMLFLTLSGNPDFAVKKAHLEDWVHRMQDTLAPGGENQLSLYVRVQQIAKGQATRFYEMHLAGPDTIREKLEIRAPSGRTHSLEFQISPAAFFQPNTRQAEQLYSRALALAEIDESSVVYDLYCGTGTVGICLAREAKTVIGVELSPEAALDARENAKRNGIDNYTVLCGDVGTLLGDPQQQLPVPDVVIVDPPRAGLSDTALSHLLKLKPRQLVYISCNPKSQALNLAVLVEAGYEIEAIQAVDQFPHTLHVENIVSLKHHGP